MNIHLNGHTHYQAVKPNLGKECLSHPEKIEQKKSSIPSENKKYATTQTDIYRQENVLAITKKMAVTEKCHKIHFPTPTESDVQVTCKVSDIYCYRR